MEDIRQAIEHAVQAGKLRTYVRENGNGLAGLERLAGRHSAAASRALEQVCGGTLQLENSAPPVTVAGPRGGR
jgi:hypothetical protein